MHTEHYNQVIRLRCFLRASDLLALYRGNDQSREECGPYHTKDSKRPIGLDEDGLECRHSYVLQGAEYFNNDYQTFGGSQHTQMNLSCRWIGEQMMILELVRDNSR